MQGSVSYYANQVAHYSTGYRTLNYLEFFRLKKVGYNNGYGHALAIRMYGSKEPTNANYARTFVVEILETKNCTVTMLNSMTKYSEIAGTGSTNYEAKYETTCVENGLRELGDDNTTSTIFYDNNYVKTSTSNGLFNYELSGRTIDGTYQSVVTTASSTATTKSRNATGFDPTSFFYYSGTNRTNGANFKANAYKIYSGINFAYSSNCGSTLVAYEPVFLVGTMVDGYFYLDETWWS